VGRSGFDFQFPCNRNHFSFFRDADVPVAGDGFCGPPRGGGAAGDHRAGGAVVVVESHPCSSRFGDAIRRDEAFAYTISSAAKHQNTAPAEHRSRANTGGNGPIETGGDFAGAL
jgi:hypothetical protein